ncbi:hypothetical protein [Ectothiorhodospira haloalkaliphila]|uniref:hypothetical protein n=1 Tax=Ectothiorhodospira haloalkaliphila TaxID=421628 RepID=UPI000FFB196B|nr:hypothetical protein [Ectothiorhodospira haloalkaliphila]
MDLSNKFSPALIATRRNNLKGWIDPYQVIYTRKSAEWPFYIRHWPWLACPGQWDLCDSPKAAFREAELREFLLENGDHSRTASYKRLVNELQRHGRTRFPRCESKEEIELYFQEVKALFSSMREHGYQPARHHEANTDIMVRIDRDGRLIKCGEGTHRLAIARILNLKAVKVQIDLVHSRWARRCVNRYDLPVKSAIAKWMDEITIQQLARNTSS